ncbi:magnesium/cobalt transporter CorA [Pedobacter flavus]|uniref:Magnesium transport protein CorA n=1 Tax=Pedobacter flavus TaxID=3113906 RepID=A0ABU7H314_9SPHI|nr:magnesium/cobalt transporter CorA [Pedobacter sp. VNH31]MEE1885603.1 magnesium/cobalt transporter CorA [Pedobacter sp. VNH31]
MQHKNRKKLRKKYSFPEPGSSPGTLILDPNALDTVILLHVYNHQIYKNIELSSLSELKEIILDPDYFYWVDIKGLKSLRLYAELEKNHGINKLVLEDLTQTYQRPTLQEYPDYIYAVSRILDLDAESKELLNEQLAFILKKNILFTFKETYSSNYDGVINRLIAGKGNIRTSGSSYLMYAIMDTIVDNYFKLLNSIGEELDDLEDQLLIRPTKTIMFHTQQIKRKIITIRRIAWPERDKLNDIIRSDNDLISASSKLYFKDAYDHCVQIIDVLESLKEISANIIDMYLSIISNRMNEIMKFLTIISSIFIPLTFIAGIYGMNFERVDPETQQVLPLNMPELYSANGYLYTLIVMFIIAIGQIIYFWRKGWFR